MFFQFVSSISKQLYDFYNYISGNRDVRFITINMGGRVYNPFEYYIEMENKDSFQNYKTILSSLTVEKLKEYLEDVRFQDYDSFRTFVNTLDEGTIFDYFFSNPKDSKTKLKLENKVGRSVDSNRFNPVEHGYDIVYGKENVSLNQYQYVREYGVSGGDIRDLVLLCLEISFENSVSMDDNYRNLVLFDIMNLVAVYSNYEEFDKIYVENMGDTRIQQLIWDGKPSIITTQEGKLSEMDGLRLLGSSEVEGGTNIYSYNISEKDMEVFSVGSTPESNNKHIGTQKGLRMDMNIYGKKVVLNSLHGKEPMGLPVNSSLEEYVDKGLVGLFDGSDDKIKLVMGDFNPNSNEDSNKIKDYVNSKTHAQFYPEKDRITTKKVRSGYCAQMSKMFKTENSEVSKDIVFYKLPETVSVRGNSVVYPEVDTLLTSSWYGDHSSVSITLGL